MHDFPDMEVAVDDTKYSLMLGFVWNQESLHYRTNECKEIKKKIGIFPTDDCKRYDKFPTITRNIVISVLLDRPGLVRGIVSYKEVLSDIVKQVMSVPPNRYHWHILQH